MHILGYVAAAEFAMAPLGALHPAITVQYGRPYRDSLPRNTDLLARARGLLRHSKNKTTRMTPAQQEDAADKRRAIGALRAPSSSRRLQLILVLDGPTMRPEGTD